MGRCIQLIKEEGKPFTPETILQATQDRIVPVLMTALVAALALVPLMLAGGEPGKEILNPLANVIFGGLVSSTIISLFLTPALFYKFGERIFQEESSLTTVYLKLAKKKLEVLLTKMQIKASQLLISLKKTKD